jgi:hypothetical protein
VLMPPPNNVPIQLFSKNKICQYQKKLRTSPGGVSSELQV